MWVQVGVGGSAWPGQKSVSCPRLASTVAVCHHPRGGMQKQCPSGFVPLRVALQRKEDGELPSFTWQILKRHSSSELLLTSAWSTHGTPSTSMATSSMILQ
jgi:hypothetical protein